MFLKPKRARYFRKNNTYAFIIPSAKSFWKQSNKVFIEKGTTDAGYGVDLAYIVY